VSQDLGEAVLKLTTDDGAMQKGLDKAGKDAERSGKEIAAGIMEAMTAAYLFASKLVEAWAEADRAQVQLNFAVKSSAALYDGATRRLNEFAQSMKELTGIDDDLIKSQLGIEATFGLTEQQMKDVMTAALNLSSMGIVSLDQAVKGLSGSFEGSIGMLGRYVPQLRDLTKEQLAAGDAVTIANEKFKGMAETLGNTVSGKLAKLGVAWGDVMEQMGRVLELDLGWLFKPITNLLNLLTNIIGKTIELRAAQAAFKDGTASLEQQITVLNQALKDNAAKIENIHQTQLKMVKLYGEAITKSDDYKYWNRQQVAIQSTREEMLAALKAMQDYQKNLDDAQAKADALAAAAAKAAKDAADALAAAEAAEAERVDGYIQFVIHQQAEAWEKRKVLIAAEKQAIADTLAVEIASNSVRMQIEADLTKAMEDTLAVEIASNSVRMQIEADLTKAKGEALAAEIQANSDRMQNEKDTAEGIANAEKDAADKTEKAWKDAWNNIQSFSSSVLGSLTTIANLYYQNQLAMAGEDTAKQKEIKQAQWTAQRNLSLASAIMSTAQAVMQTFTGFGGWPLGVLPAAIMAGLGAVQIGLIKDQPMPEFAQGGEFIVPPGYPDDSYPMRVQSGERVSVTPAGEGESMRVTMMLDSRVLGTWLGRASKNQEFIIHAGAIVP